MRFLAGIFTTLLVFLMTACTQSERQHEHVLRLQAAARLHLPSTAQWEDIGIYEYEMARMEWAHALSMPLSSSWIVLLHRDAEIARRAEAHRLHISESSTWDAIDDARKTPEDRDFERRLDAILGEHPSGIDSDEFEEMRIETARQYRLPDSTRWPVLNARVNDEERARIAHSLRLSPAASWRQIAARSLGKYVLEQEEIRNSPNLSRATGENPQEETPEQRALARASELQEAARYLEISASDKERVRRLAASGLELPPSALWEEIYNRTH